MEKAPEKKRGRIIVVEGPDGVGKTTQTKMLVDKLKESGREIKTIKFPQYETNFFGKLIRECLDGKHGDFANMDPSIVSSLYAFDRWESNQKLEKWLKAGYVIIADRYTTANQIHQGGKVENPKKRSNFMNWLDKMEFGVLGLRKPDLVVYLHAPFEVSKKLLESREEEMDTVETDENYLRRSIASAEKLAKDNKNWFRIECAPHGELLPPDEIHEEVWKKVAKMI